MSVSINPGPDDCPLDVVAGAATPEEFINAVIQNAICIANGHTQAAADYAVEGVQRVTNRNYYASIAPHVYYNPVAVEPDMYDVEDGLLIYETERDELADWLEGLYDDFIDEYMSTETDAYPDAILWIKDVINNGYIGIPPALEDAIWQRARDRNTVDAQSKEAEVISGITARGLQLPTGTFIKAAKGIRFAGVAANGVQSTVIATKQAEIAMENCQLAIKEAMKARFAVLSAAGDFLQAMALAPEIASKLTETETDAKAKMMGAVATLYNARQGVDRLLQGDRVTGRRQDLSEEQLDISIEQSKLAQYLDATGQAAKVFGTSSQAALSSLSSVVSSGTSSFG